MSLSSMRIYEFGDLLASQEPAPGGGSTAALEGSLSAALISMVCALSLGRPKYATREQALLRVRTRAEHLRVELLDAMEADTAAFNQVSAAFCMPKQREEEKAARSVAIQKALVLCTEVPLQTMRLCTECLQLAGEVLEGFNETAASDLGVAILSAEAGVMGAHYNVQINLGSLKDEDYREKTAAIAQQLLQQAQTLAAAQRAALAKRL